MNTFEAPVLASEERCARLEREALNEEEPRRSWVPDPLEPRLSCEEELPFEEEPPLEEEPLSTTSQPRPLLSASNCLRKSGWLEGMGARPAAATSEQLAKRVLSGEGCSVAGAWTLEEPPS